MRYELVLYRQDEKYFPVEGTVSFDFATTIASAVRKSEEAIHSKVAHEVEIYVPGVSQCIGRVT